MFLGHEAIATDMESLTRKGAHQDGSAAMPRFRLRTLFLAMAVLCMMLAVIRNLSSLAIAVGILFALAAIAHVAGNALGCRLRDQQPAEDEENSPPKRSRSSVTAHDCAPVTRLSRRISLGWTIVVMTVLGAIGGGYGGAELLMQSNPPENLTLANMGLGVCSFIVLGGLFGFWIGSFLQVFMVAVFQAQRESGARSICARDFRSAR